MFCNKDGTGLDLMRCDGDIVEFIVIDFTERNIPFICIHNSFIVWKEQQDLLLKKNAYSNQYGDCRYSR